MDPSQTLLSGGCLTSGWGVPQGDNSPGLRVSTQDPIFDSLQTHIRPLDLRTELVRLRRFGVCQTALEGYGTQADDCRLGLGGGRHV